MPEEEEIQEHEQYRVRKENAERWRDAGRDPFGGAFDRTH